MARFALLLPLLLLPACATIVKGRTQSLAVDSSPHGATCTIDRTGTRVGMVTSTPGSAIVSRHRDEMLVTCSKDGYVTATRTVPSGFNGATFGNILLGGVIGALVDSSTGANYSYPDAVQVELGSAVPVLPAVPPLAAAPLQPVPGTPIRLTPLAQPVSVAMPVVPPATPRS